MIKMLYNHLGNKMLLKNMTLSTFCPRKYKISNIYNIDNTNNIMY